MKEVFRNIFSPILNLFESGDEEYNYKPSHRKILVVVGILFVTLSVISITLSITASQAAGIFPALIFFGAGFVCLVVGFLGSERAIAKIWGRK